MGRCFGAALNRLRVGDARDTIDRFFENVSNYAGEFSV